METQPALRPFTDADLPLFGAWLRKPYVLKWYKDADAWLEEAEKRRSTYSFIRHFIVEYGGAPIGFCQYYDYAAGGESWHGSADKCGAYSIDYLIGEEGFLGKGLAPRIVLALEARIRQETDAKRIIVQPDRDNLPSRRTLLAAGYTYDEANDIFIKTL